ncbi:MAG: hypothetical protein H0Z18_02975 [Thermococcus sp.]|uniref:hypothetical protein n=1 Tax=Thermococcus sp. TaxID=35749 RepID=UPI001E0568B8|nr:hypothetical protein [Thermococcus sp.]MBO8174204.1 hypothetical protein [Thermococcus sp.]
MAKTEEFFRLIEMYKKDSKPKRSIYDVLVKVSIIIGALVIVGALGFILYTLNIAGFSKTFIVTLAGLFIAVIGASFMIYRIGNKGKSRE